MSYEDQVIILVATVSTTMAVFVAAADWHRLGWLRSSLWATAYLLSYWVLTAAMGLSGRTTLHYVFLYIILLMPGIIATIRNHHRLGKIWMYTIIVVVIARLFPMPGFWLWLITFVWALVPIKESARKALPPFTKRP